MNHRQLPNACHVRPHYRFAPVNFDWYAALLSREHLAIAEVETHGVSAPLTPRFGPVRLPPTQEWGTPFWEPARRITYLTASLPYTRRPGAAGR